MILKEKKRCCKIKLELVIMKCFPIKLELQILVCYTGQENRKKYQKMLSEKKSIPTVN